MSRALRRSLRRVRSGSSKCRSLPHERDATLRVGSREGMIFPAHRTSTGLLLLVESDDAEVTHLYPADRPNNLDLDALRRELPKTRRNGFALNHGRSGHGSVAVGVPVRYADGTALAGLSISMPSVRYRGKQLRSAVATLAHAAKDLESDLGDH